MKASARKKSTSWRTATLKTLLMSRRPGPDSDQSNGHGRSAFLNDAKPTMSNLFFKSTETVSPADLKKKFLDECRSEKLDYCMVVREMDNPSMSLLHQDDFSELLASFGGGAGTGDRLPLIVYKVYPDRRARRNDSRCAHHRPEHALLRNLGGIGNDDFVYNYMQSQITRISPARRSARLALRRTVCRRRWWRRRCSSRNWKCAARVESQAAAAACRAPPMTRDEVICSGCLRIVRHERPHPPRLHFWRGHRCRLRLAHRRAARLPFALADDKPRRAILVRCKS